MLAAEYDQIVSNIYSAATGQMGWWAALEPLGKKLDLWGIQILGVDKRTGAQIFGHESGLGPPQSAIDYVRHYHRVNPRIAPSLTLRPDEWFHDHLAFDEAFVEKSPFYQEFIIPYGFRYLSGTKLYEDPHSLVLFAAMRGVGKAPLGPDEMEVLCRLKQHLSQAIQIYLHLRATYSEAAAGKRLLDAFSYPMMLVDEQRGIHFRNASAIEALKSTRCVVDRRGTIGCRDLDSDTRMLLAIKALDLPNGAGATAPPTRSFARILDVRSHAPIMMFAIAMRPQAAMFAFGHQPLALLVFHDPAQKAELDPFIVGEAFDFTPAEAHVAVRLANGLAPDRIAEIGHVSISTVRSQIKSIYAKTNTNRQGELVGLLASMGGLNFVR